MQKQFPAAASRKRNFQREKCFDAPGACSNQDAKVTLPGQTNLAWVQLLPYQISNCDHLIIIPLMLLNYATYFKIYVMPTKSHLYGSQGTSTCLVLTGTFTQVVRPCLTFSWTSFWSLASLSWWIFRQEAKTH